MRLSEFQDEQAIEVVAKLLAPIGRIAANAKNMEAKGKSAAEFAGALLQNSPKEVLTMLAVLSGQEPAQYHCTAASVLADVFQMLSDPELMQLFGLRSRKAASSGSASESTEAPAT